MPGPNNWQVGELYLGPNANGTRWSQPGGPGTLVYPQPQQLSPEKFEGYQQAPMSYLALYCFGCGHYQNCAEVYEVFSEADGVQVALIVCNQCSYIQQIIVPYANYQNYIETPLVIA
jgi:hypothetical protein